MKKILLFIILLLSGSLYSQIIFSNEFNNFYRSTDSNDLFYYIFDPQYRENVSLDSLNSDLSSANVSLSYNWNSYTNLLDSVSKSDPLYYGGKTVEFDGNHYFYTDNGANIGLNDFTIQFGINIPDLLGDKFIYSKYGGAYPRWRIPFNVNEQPVFTIGDTPGGQDNWIFNLAAPEINNWFIITITGDRDLELKAYLNEELKYTDNSITWTDHSTADLTNTFRMAIGALYSDPNFSSKFIGNISFIRLKKVVITQKQVKESIYLATNWYSKNGGVYRNNWGWYQGIIGDTIYTAIPNSIVPANRQAVLSFDAWGQNGGEVIKPYTLNWDGGQSITVTNQKKKYTIYMGAMDFSSDSLYFAVPTAADTVYIDNVKLEYKHIKKQTVWDLWQ